MYNKREWRKQWVRNNPEKVKEQHRRHYEIHKEYIKSKTKQWCLDNPERRKEYKKQYYKDNYQKIRIYRQQYYKNHCEQVKENNLKRVYGLSPEDWQKIWDNQEGKCKICDVPFESPPEAYIDHNHLTGKIRGLLCSKCNFAIGLLGDDPKLMIKAIEYLRGGINYE